MFNFESQVGDDTVFATLKTDGVEYGIVIGATFKTVVVHGHVRVGHQVDAETTGWHSDPDKDSIRLSIFTKQYQGI